MAKDLFSVADVADYLGVSEQRVRSLICVDRLPASRVGSRYVIRRDDLLEYARQERVPGRPISFQNAWALLARLSGRDDARAASPRSHYRLERLLSDPDARLRALSSAEPRSELHRWRVLDSDLPKLLRDSRLALSGLSADDRSINVRYQPKRDLLDAYVSQRALKALKRELRPIEDSHQPNLQLRVPRGGSWVLDGARVPSPVVAADLLDAPDPRVKRAARHALRVDHPA